MTTQELCDELNDCSSPADVVELMEEQGVKGVQGCSHSCPIAELLYQGDDAVRVFVQYEFVDFDIRDRDGTVCTHHSPLNEEVERFQEAFDNGRYPQLEATTL